MGFLRVSDGFWTSSPGKKFITALFEALGLLLRDLSGERAGARISDRSQIDLKGYDF